MDNVNKPDLTNEELLDLAENGSSQYLNAAKEFMIRSKENKISEEERERFLEIGQNAVAQLLDFVNVDKYTVKDAVTNAVSRMVDKSFDKNR